MVHIIDTVTCDGIYISKMYTDDVVRSPEPNRYHKRRFAKSIQTYKSTLFSSASTVSYA